MIMEILRAGSPRNGYGLRNYTNEKYTSMEFWNLTHGLLVLWIQWKSTIKNLAGVTEHVDQNVPVKHAIHKNLFRQKLQKSAFFLTSRYQVKY